MVVIFLLAALCLGWAPGAGTGGGWRWGEARHTGVQPSCGGRGPPCDGVRPPRDAWTAVVLRVIDGDTVILLVRGRPVRVRLIGLDAPEIWHRRDCLGAESARALRGLLPVGSPVRVAGDREATDRYGRRLLYLWTPGGRPRPGAVTARPPALVATSLIRAGLARAMYVPPNTRYAAALHAAESTARRSGVGLWAACTRR
jgi:micrococcal nuclease